MRVWKPSLVRVGVALAMVLGVTMTSARAGQVSVFWDAPSQNADGTLLTDLTGFKVYSGTRSRQYDRVKDVGNVTQTVIDGLVDGQTYYFAVTAYDASGNESEFSDEAFKTISQGTGAPPSNPPGPGNVGLTNVVPTAYTVAPVFVGDTYYIDRSYVLTTLPSPLKGLVAIKTANGDKKNQAPEFLRFSLSQSATLYVAYDGRATRYPDWLTSAFTDTGLRIETSDVPLTVWSRDLAAGTHSLPGNANGNPSGVGSNYFVLFRVPASSPPPPPAPGNPSNPTPSPPFLDPATAVQVMLPSAYETQPLLVGDTYYIDRSYVLTDLPPQLDGLMGIKTANNDKRNQETVFLTFALTHPATLYVAYDARTTRYPTWLTDAFVDTGLTVGTSDVPLKVWAQVLPAGTHSLPGNQHGNPIGVGSNYLMLIDFQTQN